MKTTIDEIRESIARLEKTHPNSRLLRDYKNQLASYEYSKGKSAADLYCSDNPVVPTKRTKK